MQDQCRSLAAPLPPKRLHAASGLSFDPDLCLPLRHRGAGCEACAQTCPTQAITLAEREPEVSDACTGCGRCVAACPMGALHLPALETPVAADALRIDCARVPAAERSGAAVPCLGALDAAWLIERHAATGAGPVLVDRGLCESCPSGGCSSPAGDALEHARGLLESMGEALVAAGAARLVLACTEVPVGLERIHSPLLPVCVDPTLALAQACIAHWHEQAS